MRFNCSKIFTNAQYKTIQCKAIQCKTLFGKLGVLFICLLLHGCGGFSATGGPGSNVAPRLKTESNDDSLLREVNSVLLSPVDLDREVRADRSSPFPFYSELFRLASQELNLELLGGEEFLRTHYSEMGQEDVLRRSLQLAKDNGQDGVLLTQMHRYIERAGSQVGATRFASLNFTMRLYRISDSREVWRASYHFRDRPLSENILGIGDGIANHDKPGWRRADIVLEKGFREALQDLAIRRARAFERG